MDEKHIKYGRRAGALIALVIMLMPFFYQLCIDYIKDPARASEFLFINMFSLLVPSLVILMIGNFLGSKAAISPNVNKAIVWGGIYMGLFAFVFTFPLFVIWFLNIPYDTRTNLIPVFIFACLLMIALGAIHGGLVAIYVRDYRQSQRIRLIPQFTLQEMLIIISLVVVVISALATLAMLPGPYE